MMESLLILMTSVQVSLGSGGIFFWRYFSVRSTQNGWFFSWIVLEISNKIRHLLTIDPGHLTGLKFWNKPSNLHGKILRKIHQFSYLMFTERPLNFHLQKHSGHLAVSTKQAAYLFTEAWELREVLSALGFFDGNRVIATCLFFVVGVISPRKTLGRCQLFDWKHFGELDSKRTHCSKTVKDQSYAAFETWFLGPLYKHYEFKTTYFKHATEKIYTIYIDMYTSICSQICIFTHPMQLKNIDLIPYIWL